jgi:ABC-type multidrug transport system fused ATPase/permease subunit
MRPQWQVLLDSGRSLGCLGRGTSIWYVGFTLGVIICAAFSRALAPWIVRVFIDSSASAKNTSFPQILALSFLGVSLFQHATWLCATYAWTASSWRVANRLRKVLIEHCLGKDAGFHRVHPAGELVHRIDSDVGELFQVITRCAFPVLANLITIGAILSLSAIQNWRIALGFSAYLVLLTTFLYRARSGGLKFERKRQQTSAKLSGFMEEHIRAADDIRSLGATERTVARLACFHRELLRFARSLRVWSWTVGLVSQLSMIIGYVSLLILINHLHDQASITLGESHQFIQYFIMINGPMSSMASQLNQLQTAFSSFSRIGELLADERDLHRAVLSFPPPRALPSIEFDHVCFSYERGNPLLKNVSLFIEPGSRVAITGRTGSGKTTIARLIARLHEPSSGTIRIGGEDLRKLDLVSLRRSIGFLPQDPVILRSSVRDNLTLFDDGISDARVIETLRKLGLDEWLESLPFDLDTPLEGGLESLSAGRSQLLALSRLFLREPKLLILDESFARLDSATMAKLSTVLQELFCNRTILIIAHHCDGLTLDRILELRDGEIADITSARSHAEQNSLAPPSSGLWPGSS